MKVRIEELPPMAVASCRAIGVSPEVEVWAKLKDWAERSGLLEEPEEHPVFGVYRPGHAAGDPEHGYEVWIRVDEDTDLPYGVEQQTFAGGLYAVADLFVELGRDREQSWEELEGWVQMSEYGFGEHERLERLRDLVEQGRRRELYLPIVGQSAATV